MHSDILAHVFSCYMDAVLNSINPKFTLLTTPYWVVCAPGYISADQCQQQLTDIKTCEYFSDFSSFYNALLALNPGVENQALYFNYWNNYYDNVTDDQFYCLVDTPKEMVVHPIEKNFFKYDQSPLVFWQDGDFELIQKDDGYWLAVSQYRYAEDWTKIQLTNEQLGAFRTQGVKYLGLLTAEIRLQHWPHQPIWIVTVKAKIECGVRCSIAFDASEFHLDYCVVPADSADEAVRKVTDNLESDYMSVAKIYDVKLFFKSDYVQPTETGKHIVDIAEFAFDRQDIRSYGLSPYGVTSLLVTPSTTIVSKWLCDDDYWSRRESSIEICECFTDSQLCFQRLLELGKVLSSDQAEFDALTALEYEPVHYRVVSESTHRFEKMQQAYEANWQFELITAKEGHYLKVHMLGVTNQIKEIKLNEYQEYRFEKEGLSYIQSLVKGF